MCFKDGYFVSYFSKTSEKKISKKIMFNTSKNTGKILNRDCRQSIWRMSCFRTSGMK